MIASRWLFGSDVLVEQLDEFIGEGVQIDVEFSGLWIIESVGIVGLVVMNQLYNVQEIILGELNQTLAQSLHVNGGLLSLCLA